jgi:molybdate transport system substrate-binding protein
LVLVACGSTDRTVSTAPLTSVEGPTDVTGAVLVFAAASLGDSFATIEEVFEAAHPGADVVLNLAGSSALREQVLDGAPADVFASANEPIMDEVAVAGAVAGEALVLAHNRMRIVVPAGNPAGVTGLADFADEDLLIGLCAEGVPCGDFGREVLAAAGVTPSLDTSEPDVRALLTKVAVGELDAALVYATDVVAGGDDVEGIDVPDDVNVVATYPIAVLASAPNPDGAAAFVSFATSAEGQRILVGDGFAPA